MNESKEMPGFMTYREAALIFAMLPDSDAAAAIKATTNYFLFGKTPDSSLSDMAGHVFAIMRASIDRGRETYQAKVERGREYAERRWKTKEAVAIHSDDAYEAAVLDWEDKRSG